MVPQPSPQSTSPPLIPQYFAGREVFITGATGFMGKVLIERLLWTCPEISKLHLLMRQKKDVPPEKRLEQLKQSQVFKVISERCPQQLEKLNIVPGDIIQPKLGLNKAAEQQLSRVSVVFHSAANVKLNEPLGIAVENNVRSILKLMDLCDQLPLMQVVYPYKVLVHVSTAYSNSELSSVEERVYPSTISLHHLLTLIDILPEHLLAELTPSLISPKPNTYTFTKAMAESALMERARDAKYATAIFKPSIVVSSLQHPFPGWIETLNGPNGVIVGIGKGLLHVIHSLGDKRADMIPVDIAIDMLIAVAWETGVDLCRDTRVYNCSSYDNPMTWNEFKNRIMFEVRRHPFDKGFWYPFFFYIENRLVMTTSEWLLQTAPLHILHFLYTMCGIKLRPSFKTINHSMQAMNHTSQFVLMHDWKFSTDNIRQLKERLAPADAALYNLDVHTIDWDYHFANYVQGTRRYLLKEPEETTTSARLRIKILLVVHRLTQCLMAFLGYRLALRSLPAILWTISILTSIK